MKLKIFWGCAKDVVDQFNSWAKGKVLNKEVIIHEHTYTTIPTEPAVHTANINRSRHDTYTTIPTEPAVMILLFVYYPELPQWEETPKMLTAPIHDKPYPHIREDEIKVTQ